MDFSDLGGVPVTKSSGAIDFSDLGGKRTNSNEDSPSISGIADTISKGMNFLNNPGYAMRGEQPPQTIDNGGFGGDSLFQKAGEKINDAIGIKHPYLGAGLGTLISMANPQNYLAPSGDGVKLPGAGTAEELAQSSGRRALGYTKAMLKKPGALEDANATAQTMIDQGVITNPVRHPFSSGASDILDRAEELSQNSGQNIGNTISALNKTGKQAFDVNELGSTVSDQLMPKFKGGAYDAEKNIVNEIVDTIGAHGNGPISFQSAQDLKQKLYDLGKFNSNTDQLKATLYRRAGGIVNDALNNSVEGAVKDVNPNILPQYLKDKKIYGASEQAQKALNNRVASEAGNKRIGLTDTIAGGAELAHGNAGAAIALLGIKHGLENAGNATAATLANAYAKSGISPEILRGILAAYGQSKASTSQSGQ